MPGNNATPVRKFPGPPGSARAYPTAIDATNSHTSGCACQAGNGTSPSTSTYDFSTVLENTRITMP